MKVLAIADRPPRTPIKEILSQNPVDLIVTLGDLDLYELKELEDVKDIPKIGVYGNHDSGMYFDPLGIKNMHMQTFEFQGLLFGGFQGSMRYKEGDMPMFTEEEAGILLKDYPHVDVFLAHSPPYGINDDPTEVAHTGFQALRDYIEREHPKYFLHGHTYPSEKELITEYLGTKIIYVYQDKILDL